MVVRGFWFWVSYRRVIESMISWDKVPCEVVGFSRDVLVGLLWF